MDRRKWLPLALLGAAACLLGVALLALTHADTAAENAAALCPLDAAAVTAVHYTQDGEDVALQKNGDTWSLADDAALPLDQTSVQTMLESICALQAQATLQSADIQGDTGFAAPELTLSLETGTQAFSLTVGALNPVSQIYYAKTGDDGLVYTVFSADISGLCPSRRGLYAGESPAGLAAADITAMAVQNSAETLEFSYTDETWHLANEPDTEIDQVTVARMANTACNLKTTWAVTSPGPDAAYGLDAPNATVTLTAADGSTVTLRFGDTLPGEIEGDAGSCYLASDARPGIVFETEAEHLAAFAATRESLTAPEAAIDTQE